MNGKRRENTHHTCARDTNSSSKSTRTKRCGASGEWWRPPALEMRCSTFPKTTQQRTIKTFPLGENTCKGKLGTAKTVENDSTTPERPRNDSGNQRSFAKLLAAYVSPKRTTGSGKRAPSDPPHLGETSPNGKLGRNETSEAVAPNGKQIAINERNKYKLVV